MFFSHSNVSVHLAVQITFLGADFRVKSVSGIAYCGMYFPVSPRKTLTSLFVSGVGNDFTASVLDESGQNSPHPPSRHNFSFQTDT